MSKVSPADDVTFTDTVPVLVIGGGACGMTAALRAHDAGADVAILERDPTPAGSTAMSSGFVPAPATQCQLAAGLAEADSPEIFAGDILAKSKGKSDKRLVEIATTTIGPTLDWLAAAHGLQWIVLDDFLYPGHSRHRMHATPEKTGAGLIARLTNAVETAGIPLLTSAHVTELFVADGSVRGVRLARPDGTSELIGCTTLVLACNGYGGNAELVRDHIPQMADAPYYGHAGNQGDALIWGRTLGAEAKHLSACQGHGSLGHPHGILITWALMMEGGIQVNSNGQRFSDEHQGYSEQAIPVLAQPGAIAWSLFDRRLRDFAQSFPDFRDAEQAGAVREAADAGALAAEIGVPADALQATLDDVAACQAGTKTDAFGRDFTTKPALTPPYCAVKVTGALFHTQGGLMIDNDARVLRPDGSALANLFAGGGAACGVSGPDIDGYLSGNGLLTAIAFGALAGASAAKQVLNAQT